MTWMLELVRRRLFRWNHFEAGDIFRRIKGVEVEIADLQMREDQEGVTGI